MIIEFGEPDKKDGICNGGLTYYSLQKLSEIGDDACVKMRFYEFEGAPLELKSRIAKAKNQNRSVTSSDDANFMGYFDRIKDQLGDYSNLVKWETGDVNILQADNSINATMMIRLISALKIDEPYHWEFNPSEHFLSSHKKKRSLLTSSSRSLEDFIDAMRGD
jgi:hypothetical protein